MLKKLATNLTKIVNSLENQVGKEKFLERIAKGKLTIDENPKDHFVVALAVYDPVKKKIFIGHHKKSDQWVFPGGHIEKNELPLETAEREMKEELGLEEVLSKPLLMTKTPINDAGNQKCNLHYDVWYFISVNNDVFIPDKDNYLIEFYKAGWKAFTKARKIITIPSYLKPIDYIEQYLI